MPSDTNEPNIARTEQIPLIDLMSPYDLATYILTTSSIRTHPSCEKICQFILATNITGHTFLSLNTAALDVLAEDDPPVLLGRLERLQGKTPSRTPVHIGRARRPSLFSIVDALSAGAQCDAGAAADQESSDSDSTSPQSVSDMSADEDIQHIVSAQRIGGASVAGDRDDRLSSLTSPSSDDLDSSLGYSLILDASSDPPLHYSNGALTGNRSDLSTLGLLAAEDIIGAGSATSSSSQQQEEEEEGEIVPSQPETIDDLSTAYSPEIPFLIHDDTSPAIPLLGSMFFSHEFEASDEDGYTASEGSDTGRSPPLEGNETLLTSVGGSPIVGRKPEEEDSEDRNADAAAGLTDRGSQTVVIVDNPTTADVIHSDTLGDDNPSHNDLGGDSAPAPCLIPVLLRKDSSSGLREGDIDSEDRDEAQPTSIYDALISGLALPDTLSPRDDDGNSHTDGSMPIRERPPGLDASGDGTLEDDVADHTSGSFPIENVLEDVADDEEGDGDEIPEVEPSFVSTLLLCDVPSINTRLAVSVSDGRDGDRTQSPPPQINAILLDQSVFTAEGVTAGESETLEDMHLPNDEEEDADLSAAGTPSHRPSSPTPSLPDFLFPEFPDDILAKWSSLYDTGDSVEQYSKLVSPTSSASPHHIDTSVPDASLSRQRRWCRPTEPRTLWPRGATPPRRVRRPPPPPSRPLETRRRESDLARREARVKRDLAEVEKKKEELEREHDGDVFSSVLLMTGKHLNGFVI